MTWHNVAKQHLELFHKVLQKTRKIISENLAVTLAITATFSGA